MVIVMSPQYLQSDACDFQTKFAHALSPGQFLTLFSAASFNLLHLPSLLLPLLSSLHLPCLPVLPFL